jgi:hypothetical protein
MVMPGQEVPEQPPDSGSKSSFGLLTAAFDMVPPPSSTVA